MWIIGLLVLVVAGLSVWGLLSSSPVSPCPAGNKPGECGCDLSVVKDECGACGGTGPGECGCDLSVVKDACGECGGDGMGCAGCDGVPNSGKKYDSCSVCGGDGPGECGCDLSVVKEECDD